MSAMGWMRDLASDQLWLWALRRHRSRMGYRDSPRYTKYLRQAQASFRPVANADALAVSQGQHFHELGWSAFATPETERVATEILATMKGEEAEGLSVWKENGRYALGDVWLKFPQVESLFRGVVGDFLHACFGAHFKIFYGASYRSWRQRDYPVGSELWHADGGPGTCINLMFCLTPSTSRNGTMECLSWPDSLRLFSAERPVVRRRIKRDGMISGEGPRTARAEYYREMISEQLASRITQPIAGPGLVYAFSNNVVHKGGFPEPGEERYVLLFHVYPSIEPTPYERYRANGVPKTAPLPLDPAF